MIELHNEDYAKGVHDFSMEMNAFGDLVSAHGRQNGTSSLQLFLSHLSFAMISLLFLKDQYRIQGTDDWLSKHGIQGDGCVPGASAG